MSLHHLDPACLITGSNALIWIGPRCATCWSVSPWDGRRRWQISLGSGVSLASLVQFVTEFILGLLELLNGLAEAARQFRQFLGPEKNENDQQNDDQVGAAQVHEAGEDAHI